MPVIGDESAAPSTTTHAKLAADSAAASERQREMIASEITHLASLTARERRDFGAVTAATRNNIISLSLATAATAHHNFPAGSKELQEALKMSRDLASKTGLPFESISYQRQMKEIERLSWSQYSQDQFEGKVQRYVEGEIAKWEGGDERKGEQRSGRGLEGIREVEEMAEAAGLRFESGG